MLSLKTSNCGRHILRLPPSVQSCWIYSVFVEKARIPLKAAPSAHFNLENIKNLMSDTKELSSNAETFKNLFDTFHGATYLSHFLGYNLYWNLMPNIKNRLQAGSNREEITFTYCLCNEIILWSLVL